MVRTMDAITESIIKKYEDCIKNDKYIQYNFNKLKGQCSDFDLVLIILSHYKKINFEEYAKSVRELNNCPLFRLLIMFKNI